MIVDFLCLFLFPSVSVFRQGDLQVSGIIILSFGERARELQTCLEISLRGSLRPPDRQ